MIQTDKEENHLMLLEMILLRDDIMPKKKRSQISQVSRVIPSRERKTSLRTTWHPTSPSSSYF